MRLYPTEMGSAILKEKGGNDDLCGLAKNYKKEVSDKEV